MKKRCCAIGEVLIDFIPEIKDERLKDVSRFKRVAGGAPANVCGAISKLGIPSILLTQVGNDAFGDYLIESLKEQNVQTNYIKKSNDYDTSLAFVSLAQDGNRDFKFYRKTAADLQFSKDDIPHHLLDDCGIIHFCSVDLIESPMKEAHRYLIQQAIEKNILVSFDPNLRFSLWDDLDALKATVIEFMKYADILKISDEELEFITGHRSISDALAQLLKDRCQIVIYTKGKDGAELYTKDFNIKVNGCSVDVTDTTGAGDSFIGAFIYQLLQHEVTDLDQVTIDEYEKYLDFSNLYAAYMTTVPGALSSMADLQTINHFKNTLR